MTAVTKGVKLWNQLIFHTIPLKNPERHWLAVREGQIRLPEPSPAHYRAGVNLFSFI